MPRGSRSARGGERQAARATRTRRSRRRHVRRESRRPARARPRRHRRRMAPRAGHDSRTRETTPRSPATARASRRHPGSVRCLNPSRACASVPASPTILRVAASASHRSRIAVGPIEQRRQRLRRAQQIGQQRARDRHARLVAPFAVAVEPFESVDRGVPLLPAQRRPGRAGMRRHAESAKPTHVFDHILRACPRSDTATPAGRSSRSARRWCSARRRRWSARRRDTPAHPASRVPSPWSVRMMNCSPARAAAAAIAVDAAAAVRAVGVNMKGAANRRRPAAARCAWCRAAAA